MRNFPFEGYYRNVYNGVSEATNGSFEFMDYYGAYFDNNSYFVDSDHLNIVGAEIFSKKLNEDLRNLSDSA